MIAPNAVHPSHDDLTAFANGKLDDTQTERIAAHLAECDNCRAGAANAPDDSFAGRVKSADGTLPPVDAIDVPDNLPPELADHPRYHVVRKLGQGGMGVVYQAKHKVMNRLVAIKVIARNFVDNPDAIARFHREVQAAAKLTHPNIATAYDAEQIGNLHTLVMEFVDGQSLDRVLQRKGPLPINFACAYIRQAALGLQHAFEQGMVHRDIKPQNMMLTPKGQIKVLDFGLARMASEQAGDKFQTAAGAYMGTPEFMAPEQATDARTADIRADIYSLGCTLYFLLTGRPPFQGGTLVQLALAHIEDEPPPISQFRADVPAELAMVIERMLAKKPADRFQTPRELAQALVPFVKAEVKASAPLSAPDLKSPNTGTVVARDTSRPATKSPVENPSAYRAPSLARLPVNAFAGLQGEVPTIGREQRPVRSRSRPTRKPWHVWAAITAAVGLLLVSGIAAAIVLTVKTKDGIIELTIDQKDAEVYVDGERISVTVRGDAEPMEIHKKPGIHKLEIRKGGFKIEAREVTLTANGRGPIGVSLVPEPAVVVIPKPNVTPVSTTPNDDAKVQPIKPSDDNLTTPVISDDQSGWKQLFNGNDLTGWVGKDGRPARWKVENGYLEVPTPSQGNISTKETFGDFQLHAEFWIPHIPGKSGQGMGNSGIYLQGRYEIQILDSFNNATKPDQACGALYGQIGPSRNVSKPPEQWQSFDITFRAPRADGEGSITENGRLTVIHNGVTVIDNREFSKPSLTALDSNQGTPGPIVLQDHGNAVRFRNLRMRPLTAVPAVPAQDAGQVWQPLFNGKDKTGWRTYGGQKGKWQVIDGILTGFADRSHLYSVGTSYSDIHLRSVVRINAGGNSGIFVRSSKSPAWPAKSPEYPMGYEVQIYSSNTPQDPQPPTGSVFVVDAGALAVVRNFSTPPGQWFTMEIIARGDRIEVLIDGKKVNDFRDQRLVGGHIALQCNNPKTVVEFKSIEIKDLSSTKK